MTHRSADVIVLSPHLDDAVLSVGGLISREVAAGRTVEVWTCFTEGPPLDTIPAALYGLGDYAARRAEDTRALDVLGAGHRWLDFQERIWREPPLRQDYHIFHTPPSVERFQFLPALRATVRELLLGASEFYAPLAVGHHHDHVEVTLAVLLEMIEQRRFDRVRFYEDPYALGGACRRAHFVTRRRMWRLFDSPFWASPRMGALVWAAAMASKGPPLQTYAPAAEQLRWSCAAGPVHADDERRKLDAVAEYASQVKAFGGMDVVSAFIKQGHSILGGEPIWQASSAVASIPVGLTSSQIQGV
jgi:LmbE family N-acetylglucosaminyl deacetylase